MTSAVIIYCHHDYFYQGFADGDIIEQSLHHDIPEPFYLQKNILKSLHRLCTDHD